MENLKKMMLRILGLLLIAGAYCGGSAWADDGAATWPGFDFVAYTNTEHTVKVGDVTFTDCRVGDPTGTHFRVLQCGTLNVPENYREPDGKKLQLFIARIPAAGKKNLPDPFVPIAGGPGSAASEIYLFPAQGFDKIQQERDIYIIDQRGTGKSHKFGCDGAQEDMWEYTEEQRIRLRNQLQACLRAFDGDPRQYTTSVAVQDYESVRKALGVVRWNIYGASYGTRVAQQYMRRYPQALRSVILDAVAAPQVALGVSIAWQSQRALEALLTRCEQESVCSDRFPTLREGVNELFAQLKKAPLNISVNDFETLSNESMTFTHGHLAAITRMYLYRSDSLAILPLLFEEAYARKNYGPLARNALEIQKTMSALIAVGMHNSVVCSEDIPFLNVTAQDRAKLATTYMGEESLQMLMDMCAVWPIGQVDPDFKTPVASDIPVLLLSGGIDPITPPAYAEMAAREFHHSRHIVAPNVGHGLAAQSCVPALLAQFINANDFGSLDTACIENLPPTPFFVDFNGPSP